MPAAPAQIRPFRVQARHVEPHHARVLSEASFEAAAIAYVEDLHAPGDGPEIASSSRTWGPATSIIDLEATLHPAPKPNETRHRPLSQL